MEVGVLFLLFFPQLLLVVFRRRRRPDASSQSELFEEVNPRSRVLSPFGIPPLAHPVVWIESSSQTTSIAAGADPIRQGSMRFFDMGFWSVITQEEHGEVLEGNRAM